MKNLIQNGMFYLVLIAVQTNAQNLTTRSQNFTADFSDPKNYKETSVPKIKWLSPVNEVVYTKESKLDLKFEIESHDPLKRINISLREKDQAEVRGSKEIVPTEDQKRKYLYEKPFQLIDGVNILELVVENEDGIQSKSQRIIHVGETALADAAKLNRKDYALIFATDKYDNWKELVNPVFDARTIANELKNTYGFEVDVNENVTQDQVWKKILEYTDQKKYGQLDQLLVFFAGHGNYDDSFKEGYVVTRESLPNDIGKQSYISYDRLRGRLNNIPCDHIFLVMDVCFGGTFDEAIASSRKVEDVTYKETSQSNFIIRALEVKTRKYLTSGGKQYVSDGIAGQHSPFARKFIDALSSHGGNDGMLTLNELKTYVEKLEMRPRFGKFGIDEPESEFVFVVK